MLSATPFSMPQNSVCRRFVAGPLWSRCVKTLGSPTLISRRAITTPSAPAAVPTPNRRRIVLLSRLRMRLATCLNSPRAMGLMATPIRANGIRRISEPAVKILLRFLITSPVPTRQSSWKKSHPSSPARGMHSYPTVSASLTTTSAKLMPAFIRRGSASRSPRTSAILALVDSRITATTAQSLSERRHGSSRSTIGLSFTAVLAIRSATSAMPCRR